MRLLMLLCSTLLMTSAITAFANGRIHSTQTSRLDQVQVSCVASDGAPLHVNVGTFKNRTGRYIETISYKNFRPQDYQLVPVLIENQENGMRSFKQHPYYLTIATKDGHPVNETAGLYYLFGYPYRLQCEILSKI